MKEILQQNAEEPFVDELKSILTEVEQGQSTVEASTLLMRNLI